MSGAISLREANPSGGVSSPLLADAWLLLGLCMVGHGLMAFFVASWASSAEWWLHGIWCLLGLIFTIPVITLRLRSGFAQVLTDHRLMFCAAFSLYFLMGASFMSFGPEDEVAKVSLYFPTDALDALRVDAANAIGFGVAILTSVFVPTGWARRTAEAACALGGRLSVATALATMTLLGGLSSAYVLLFDFGFLEGVVPGIYRSAGSLLTVAIFLGASREGAGGRPWRILAVVLAGCQSILGVFLFSKTQVLIPLGALMIGIAAHYRPRLVVVVGLALMGAMYLAIASPITYARNTLGTTTNASLAERWHVFSEGLAAQNVYDPATETSIGGRFSYIVPQSAGMYFYDTGAAASDFELMGWAFLPRWVFSDKPIMTDTAEAFHEKITGNRGSHTGLGVFLSGYYSGGWLGVLCAAAIAGFVLAQTSAIAQRVIGAGAPIMLPFALYGVFIAFRIDGDFLNDYVGSFALIFYLLVVFSCLSLGNSRTVHTR